MATSSRPLFAFSCFIVVIGFACAAVAAVMEPGACVQCLCESESGAAASCIFGTGGCHDGVCGPFAITYPYWQDSGRPTVALNDRDSVTTYEKCALDPACAQATVHGYMAKFHQDCTGDGVEDCQDYARIHYHGGYACNKPLSPLNQNALDACLRRLNVDKPIVDVDVPASFWEEDESNTLPPDIDVRLGESD